MSLRLTARASTKGCASAALWSDMMRSMIGVLVAARLTAAKARSMWGKSQPGSPMSWTQLS